MSFFGWGQDTGSTELLGTIRMNEMKIAVVIASLGRPDAIADLLELLDAQSRKPDHIVLSVTTEADLPAGSQDQDLDVVFGEKGLPRQRNRGMELVLADYDLLVFFDDDYIPSKTAIEGIVDFFKAHGDIVGINGVLLADGINSPGISSKDAKALVRQHDNGPRPPATVLKEKQGLYGCNMAYRISAIGAVRFDEQLPLYAWQEDIDFANQLLPQGRLVDSSAFYGVHRGAKGARTSGVKLGYSQIANPVYLLRKGTIPRRLAYRIMTRNFIANLVKTLKPEPWIDRWGRVKGNWLALRHLFLGKLSPDHILKI